MKKQVKDNVRYFARFILQGISLAIIFTAFMWGLNVLAEVLTEPFNKLLWGIWEAVMGL